VVLERFNGFIGFLRCGVGFRSFEFFNGFVVTFDGFVSVGIDLDLLNSSFFFANLLRRLRRLELEQLYLTP
jgi:hypothetical protein